MLSIVGVVGNGQAELISAITGSGRFSSRQVLLFGKPLARGGRPSDAAVGYIPEDRIRTGSAPGLDVTENFLLTTYPRFCRWGWLQKKAAGGLTVDALARFHVTVPGPHALGRHLSGGNLQKLILTRELSTEPRWLIAEHPTHGLEIGATVEVWEELLRQRALAGVLLVSGDLTEVLALSDRIVVIPGGIMFAALFIAGILVGGDQPQTVMHFPASVGLVLEATLLFFVLGSDFLSRYRISRRAPRS